jgi:hypothetical protein
MSLVTTGACLQLHEGSVDSGALPRAAAKECDALGVAPQPGVQPPEGALQPVLPLGQRPKVRRHRPAAVLQSCSVHPDLSI